MANRLTPSKSTESNYATFLDGIKQRIHQARIAAYRHANRELMDLYWNIGKEIVERQNLHGWGRSVVERLSRDLLKDFPSMSGMSANNLWFMRRLYLEYKNHEILSQVVKEIPWGQNQLIMC